MRGTGQLKLREFGDAFIREVVRFCEEHNLPTNTQSPRSDERPLTEPKPRSASNSRPAAEALFQQGASLTEVSANLSRGVSTICNYLCEWIEETKPASVSPWVDDATYARVTRAYAEIGGDRLRPLWDHLDGEVHYDTIRIVLAHQRTR